MKWKNLRISDTQVKIEQIAKRTIEKSTLFHTTDKLIVTAMSVHVCVCACAYKISTLSYESNRTLFVRLRKRGRERSTIRTQSINRCPKKSVICSGDCTIRLFNNLFE